MKCEQCMGPTSVYETRRREGGKAIMRRRICRSSDCQHKFVTLEQVAVVARLRRGRGSQLRCTWAPEAPARAQP